MSGAVTRFMANSFDTSKLLITGQTLGLILGLMAEI
jgi:hypothetical protein